MFVWFIDIIIIIIAMFSFLSTVVETTFKSAALVVGGAALFAYATNPSDESLSQHIKDSTPTPIGTGLLKDAAIYALTSKSVKDYKLCKVATVNIADGNKVTFFGVFNNWFAMKKENK